MKPIDQFLDGELWYVTDFRCREQGGAARGIFDEGATIQRITHDSLKGYSLMCLNSCRAGRKNYAAIARISASNSPGNAVDWVSMVRLVVFDSPQIGNPACSFEQRYDLHYDHYNLINLQRCYA